ncbi:hypothetical protein ABQF34_18675 [Mycolicibacterium boenickei]
MPSDAIERWLSERAEALDSRVSVHAKVTGNKVGRKYDTKHLNRALFVALSAEFQGFSRDLHEDAAVHIANSLQTLPGNARVVPVVLDALVKGRRLDRGNADFSALVSDFSTLGINPQRRVEATLSRKNCRMGEDHQGPQLCAERCRSQRCRQTHDG